MVVLFGGSPGDQLDFLRYGKFCQKVATSTVFVHPQTLPPTEAATKLHSFPVYYQTQQWIDDASNLNPLDWGWTVVDSQMIPVETDLPSAPSPLLSVVRFNCKTDCATTWCSCKKHGLQCSLARAECR